MLLSNVTQVKRLRISEIITVWRKLITKPPSTILQKQVNGLLFGHKNGLQIRQINAYNSKNIYIFFWIQESGAF